MTSKLPMRPCTVSADWVQRSFEVCGWSWVVDSSPTSGSTPKLPVMFCSWVMMVGVMVRLSLRSIFRAARAPWVSLWLQSSGARSALLMVMPEVGKLRSPYTLSMTPASSLSQVTRRMALFSLIGRLRKPSATGPVPPSLTEFSARP